MKQGRCHGAQHHLCGPVYQVMPRAVMALAARGHERAMPPRYAADLRCIRNVAQFARRLARGAPDRAMKRARVREAECVGHLFDRARGVPQHRFGLLPEHLLRELRKRRVLALQAPPQGAFTQGQVRGHVFHGHSPSIGKRPQHAQHTRRKPLRIMSFGHQPVRVVAELRVELERIVEVPSVHVGCRDGELRGRAVEHDGAAKGRR